MRHRAALLSAVLSVATAVLVLPAPANAALQGFRVRISGPDTFEAGKDPRAVEAVVSTDNNGGCQKVRWSMLLRVADGVTFDDIKVTRIEDGKEFALQSQISGDTARLTDVQLDPGQLCRNSTVTSRYEISFYDGAPDGRIDYQIQALNTNSQVLEQATASSRVQGDGEKRDDRPTTPPTRAATPDPTPSETDDAAGAGAGDDEPSRPAPSAPATTPAAVPTDQVAANAANAADDGGVPSLLGPGLIVGALFVFIGVGILLRLRGRRRGPKSGSMPTSFYPTR